MTHTLVYFDGACHLCSREVAMYKRQDAQGVLQLIDISLPNFDAAAHGLDKRAVNKHMHVRDAEGMLRVGVDAFIAIWQALGKHALLIKLCTTWWLRPGINKAYAAFAHVRPYLPKRKRDDCNAGACAP